MIRAGNPWVKLADFYIIFELFDHCSCSFFHYGVRFGTLDMFAIPGSVISL